MGREFIRRLRATTRNLARDLVRARCAETFDPRRIRLLFLLITFQEIFIVRPAQRDRRTTSITARPHFGLPHPFEETRRRPPRIRLEKQRAGDIAHGGSLIRSNLPGLEEHRRAGFNELDTRRPLPESKFLFFPRRARRVVDTFGRDDEDAISVASGDAARAEDQRLETGRPPGDDRLRNSAEAEG